MTVGRLLTMRWRCSSTFRKGLETSRSSWHTAPIVRICRLWHRRVNTHVNCPSAAIIIAPLVAAKFDLYPLSSIQLPGSQHPPQGMPEVAWTNSGMLSPTTTFLCQACIPAKTTILGELFAYNNVANITGKHGLMPNEVLLIFIVVTILTTNFI